jgi:glutamine amidotransferase
LAFTTIGRRIQLWLGRGSCFASPLVTGCHLLGIVSEQPASLRRFFPERDPSARSSPSDGRGVAVWAGDGWRVNRSVSPAGEDANFDEALAAARGNVVLVHDRRRTIGRTRIANTHPFSRGAWAFAHAGTVLNPDFLRRSTSPRHLRQLEGDTDSEMLFAYLLSCVDVVGPGREAIDIALVCGVRELAARTSGDRYAFLLSDGAVLYAYQKGQPLFLLERRAPANEAHPARRGAAAAVASGVLTDEPWRLLGEGDLIRVARHGGVSVQTLASTSSPATPSGPELPFTD